MAPPKFEDLGKSAKDLFTDDYGFGETKLTLKSKSASGLDFKVEGKKTEKAVSGFIESKYTHSSGVSLKEKWSTSNVINTEISVEDKLVKGSKFTLDSAFSPNAGLQAVGLKADYKRDNFFGNLSFGAVTGINAAGVLKHGSHAIGGKVDYDYRTGSIAATRLGTTYEAADLTLAAFVNNVGSRTDVEGSVFHTPRDNI